MSYKQEKQESGLIIGINSIPDFKQSLTKPCSENINTFCLGKEKQPNKKGNHNPQTIWWLWSIWETILSKAGPTWLPQQVHLRGHSTKLASRWFWGISTPFLANLFQMLQFLEFRINFSNLARYYQRQIFLLAIFHMAIRDTEEIWSPDVSCQE